MNATFSVTPVFPVSWMRKARRMSLNYSKLQVFFLIFVGKFWCVCEKGM